MGFYIRGFNESKVAIIFKPGISNYIVYVYKRLHIKKERN